MTLPKMWQAADLERPPREFAERSYNVQQWTEMPRGGHFAAHEQPQLLADDIRRFFGPLRAWSSCRYDFG